MAHLEGAIENVGYQGYRDSYYKRDGGSREEVAHLEEAIEEVGHQGYRDSNYNRDGGFKRGGGPPRGGNRGGRLPRLQR